MSTGARVEIGGDQKAPESAQQEPVGDISSEPGARLAAAAAATQQTISVIDLNNRVQSQANEPAAASRMEVGENSSQQQQQQHQWLAQVAAQTHLEVRQRMSQAGGQLNHSIRQIYASASSIAAEMPPAYHNIPGIVPYGNQGRSLGPPPSYDDVINPYAPPPTYQSLYGQMREARKRSRGLVDLISRLLIIMVSTLGCTMLVAFMIIIPFAMIIVGAAYIDECHIEHIPAFLLVGGLVWASKSILHCYSQCRQMPPPANHNHHNNNNSSDFNLADIYSTSASSLSSSSSSSSTSSSTSHEDGQSLANGPALTNPNSSEENLDIRQAMASNAVVAPSSVALESEAGRASHRSQRITRNNNHRRAHHNHHHRNHLHHADTQRDDDYDDGSSRRLKSSICESLLNCVLFGWFIAGCIIVFRNYEPDFENSNSPRYCHRTVYMFTFWLITSAILLLGLFIGCICCLMVSSAVASRRDDVDSEDLA